MKKLLLASTSTLYEDEYLNYLLPVINIHFKEAETLLFIPYAQPGGISCDDYTERVQDVFDCLDIEVKGLHTFKDPQKAIQEAQGIFTGGGNTFLLVNALYKHNLFPVLREAIFKGTPYLGTSAGTNIAGVTMQTTNDMPIVHPPSLKTLGAIPFNINPHYLDPPINGKHMGETRATRIKEFHKFNNLPVVGLREGSWLEVQDKQITLKGKPSARIFEKDLQPYEVETGTILNFL